MSEIISTRVSFAEAWKQAHPEQYAAEKTAEDRRIAGLIASIDWESGEKIAPGPFLRHTMYDDLKEAERLLEGI